MKRNGKSLWELPIMSIENPTLSAAADLAHFRHFIRRGGFSSLFTNVRSTTVENVRQIYPFYAKQTQCQVRQNHHKHLCSNEIQKMGHLVIQTNKANSNPIQSQFKPKQTQLKPKQTQNKANFKRDIY